jgi:hypothetical protein
VGLMLEFLQNMEEIFLTFNPRGAYTICSFGFNSSKTSSTILPKEALSFESFHLEFE